MRYEIKMPSLGADMDQGKLMMWKIKPGDRVKKGQSIASVETTKAVMEIESFRDGSVLELTDKIGETFQVGAPIGALEIDENSTQEEKKLPQLP